jgi:hypothetical protein
MGVLHRWCSNALALGTCITATFDEMYARNARKALQILKREDLGFSDKATIDTRYQQFVLSWINICPSAVMSLIVKA